MLTSRIVSLHLWEGAGLVPDLNSFLVPDLCHLAYITLYTKVSQLESVDWRVDYILGSSALQVSLLVQVLILCSLPS